MRKVQLYDETAPAYHRRYRQIQRTKYQAISPYLHVEPIVDVGIGTGIGLPSLASFSTIVGVDGAIEMLRVANEQVRQLSRRPSVLSLICAFVEALPFRESCIPTILSITMIQNISDIQQGLGELSRVLQTKGILAVTSLSRILPFHDLLSNFKEEFKVIASFENLANEDDGIIMQLL